MPYGYTLETYAQTLCSNAEPRQRDDILITYEDVEKMLSVSRDTIRRILADGKIQAVKLTDTKQGSIRFSRNSVQDFIHSRLNAKD